MSEAAQDGAGVCGEPLPSALHIFSAVMVPWSQPGAHLRWVYMFSCCPGHVIMETDISSFLLGPAVIPLLPGCITVLVTLQIHQLMAGRCLCFLAPFTAVVTLSAAAL